MIKLMKYGLVLLGLVAFSAAQADIVIPMYVTGPTGPGKTVGTVTVQQIQYGLLFTPHLSGLTPGLHGFHIHENPSCANSGMAAGGHLDPQHTGKHLGPYN